jgi:uncharacterized protein (TIRG00374 family)
MPLPVAPTPTPKQGAPLAAAAAGDAGAEQAAFSAPPESRRGRAVRLVLAAAGLVLFVLVLRAVGWSAIVANLARVGPWFAGIVAVYAAAQVAFALGWWVLFEPRLPPSRFSRIFAVYLAGDAANVLAPGNVAGEPLKVHLLRPETGGSAALASVTIHKHADMAAQWVFMAAGVGVALWRFPMPAGAALAAVGATAAFGVALLILSLVLPRRTYSPLVRRLARWKALAKPLAKLDRAAARVDERISSFYRGHSRRFFVSAAWCLAGWCGGLVETRLLLHWLAPEAGWLHALAIESLAMTLNNLFLFVPAKIGSAEGVRVAVFLLVGLPAAAGAAYSILKRGREIAWMVPGLVVMFRRPPDVRRAPTGTDGAGVGGGSRGGGGS